MHLHLLDAEGCEGAEGAEGGASLPAHLTAGMQQQALQAGQPRQVAHACRQADAKDTCVQACKRTHAGEAHACR